jgi:hypothetical protein
MAINVLGRFSKRKTRQVQELEDIFRYRYIAKGTEPLVGMRRTPD